jgi:hypothetical protein
MGWLFSQGQTRKELIAKRIETQENEFGKWETIAHSIRGNCLWRVVAYSNKRTGINDKYIALDLLGSDKGYGWGYKDMTEHDGPHFYTCPLKYLTMVEEPKEEYAKNWRAKVREYHARMNRKFIVGQVIKLKSLQVPEVQIVSVKPFRGFYQNSIYRINRRLIL